LFPRRVLQHFQPRQLRPAPVVLEVRYSTKDGQSIYYHRVYTRNGSVIGVLTLTTMENDLSSIRPVYDTVLTSISFSPKD